MRRGPRPEPQDLALTQAQIVREESFNTISPLIYPPTNPSPTKVRGPRPISSSNAPPPQPYFPPSETNNLTNNQNSIFESPERLKSVNLGSQTPISQPKLKPLNIIPPPPIETNQQSTQLESTIPIELLPYIPPKEELSPKKHVIGSYPDDEEASKPMATSPITHPEFKPNLNSLQSVAEYISYKYPQTVPRIELKDMLSELFSKNTDVPEELSETIIYHLEQQQFLKPNLMMIELYKHNLHRIGGDIRSLTKSSTKRRVSSLKNEDIISPQPPQEEFELPEGPLEMNWRKFWSLSEQQVEKMDKVEVKEQFAIHELIMSEILYCQDLRLYLDVYGDLKLMRGVSVMKDQDVYIQKVFNAVDRVLKCNMDLRAQLERVQRLQGPIIDPIAVSDIICGWSTSKDTINAYTVYANGYLWSEHHIRRELRYNDRLRNWFEERSKDPKLNNRPHSFFFNRILPRLARYHLLLGAIKKYIPEDQSALHVKIDQTISFCNQLTQECDECVAKQKGATEILDLQDRIIFKSNIIKPELGLDNPNRKVIYQGDLIRRGEYRMEWVNIVAILLDNYLVMAKNRDTQNGSVLYVTRPPIPLDLLVIDFDPNEMATKLSTKLTFTIASSNESSVDLPSTSSSDSKDVSLADIENSPSIFPFRVTHLGLKGSKYLLYTNNANDRQKWIDAIVQAKQANEEVKAINDRRVMEFYPLTDEFAYPESDMPQLPMAIPNTDIYQGIMSKYQSLPPLTRVMQRRLVNCVAVVGHCQLLGTDNGVWFLSEKFMCPLTCVINYPSKVTKIEVLSYMNAVFVHCKEKNLTWFPLDQIIARGLGNDRQSIGVRLNRHKKIQEFQLCEIGKDRKKAIMYLQSGGTLKLVEPLISYRTMDNKHLIKLGISDRKWYIDFFKELDKINVSSEASNFHMFHQSAVYTTLKHFQWLSLDTKRNFFMDVNMGGAFTKERKEWGKPLKLFEHGEENRILVYETCYVMVDKFCRMQQFTVTNFTDKCVDCIYLQPYLILVNHTRELIEVIQVRLDEEGTVEQTSLARDVHFLGDKYIRTAHPYDNNRQMVFQLNVENSN